MSSSNDEPTQNCQDAADDVLPWLRRRTGHSGTRRYRRGGVRISWLFGDDQRLLQVHCRECAVGAGALMEETSSARCR